MNLPQALHQLSTSEVHVGNNYFFLLHILPYEEMGQPLGKGKPLVGRKLLPI